MSWIENVVSMQDPTIVKASTPTPQPTFVEDPVNEVFSTVAAEEDKIDDLPF